MTDILLVEDNILNQRLMSLVLKKNNYNVTLANNGIEAVKLFSENTFDLVLMDLMMPVMNGYEAAIKIREIEKSKGIITRIPIVAITANSMDNDRDKCLSSGMDEYMTKPFDIDRFHSVTSNIFRQEKQLKKN
ncbi:MAG: response regulator [Prolixibacteraceae bacterium]|nr:response regulator [Prolixibacteraceae bacterium]